MAGSGVVPVVVSHPAVSMEIPFESIVTAPFLAKALPQEMFAPVSSVILVSARMFPAKSVVVPRVAELPTCQKRLSPWPPLVKTTFDPLAVVSELPIWKMKTELGLPMAFSVSVPVSCADEEKQYTPGVSESPPRSWPVKDVPQGWPAAIP